MPFLIFGLGNPGPGYAETRHNAGFWFLDRLAEMAGATFKTQSRLQSEIARVSLHGKDCILAKPTTFMNHSGQAFRAVMDYYQVSADMLLVAYDELALPPGVARLKLGGGHGGHNGLRDIFRHTADHDFLRLRIGIGHPGSREGVTAYVLGRAPSAQERLIRDSISDAVDITSRILNGDVAGAMTELHTVREDGL